MPLRLRSPQRLHAAAVAALRREAGVVTAHRCGWVGDDPLYVSYHDEEWGVPSRDPRHLFEMLTLEGAQAGLSWITILRKRQGYRRAFADFDVRKVARLGPRDVERRLADPGIVRHRGKIDSVVSNARAILVFEREHGEGAFVDHLWSFTGGRPVINRWQSYRDAPSQTAQSVAMSRDLLKRGFRFVGPTTCYAFMQAVGMVNDHESGCIRYASLARPASGRARRAPHAPRTSRAGGAA
jgi:DNA-3-methyladenine glycosylase I